MGRQVFTAGEILTAANMNDLSDQSVMVFDDATARATAIPTPVEGMVTYLKDTDEVDKFDGSAFVPVGIAPAILQVVQTVKTNTFTTSTSAFTDIPGFSATITPSATTSKILIMTTLHGVHNEDGATHTRLVRNSTDIFLGDSAAGQIQASSGGYQGQVQQHTLSVTFLDSPATTSAVTYKVMIAVFDTPFIVNQASKATAFSSDPARLASSITLMEVAG